MESLAIESKTSEGGNAHVARTLCGKRRWKILAVLLLSAATLLLCILLYFGVFFSCDIDKLAFNLNVTLVRGSGGTLELLGKGAGGVVYAVSDRQAMKVVRGRASEESAISQSIPDTPTLLKVVARTSAWSGTLVCTGLLMHQLDGNSGLQWRRELSDHRLLLLAADISVALHALHTKITGWVVLHCDLHPGNIVVTDKGRHAVVIDYEVMKVHQLSEGETTSGKFFKNPALMCHGTDWLHFDPLSPYSFSTDWRNLGMLLYGLSVGVTFQDIYPNKGHSVFSGHNQTCDFKCAAEKNIRANLNGTLADLVMFLTLHHDSIHDEYSAVLNHASFNELEESPADAANRLHSSTVTKEFKDVFGASRYLIFG